MPEKKKFNLEYEIKSSPRILYNFLIEPNALAQWFADDVELRDYIYTFTWDGEQHRAKIIQSKDNKVVRYKWLNDDSAENYLEMEVVQDEMTNDVALCVTDFAAEADIPERKLIWKNQIDYLVSVLGA
ncbi:START-like domain-containing protein [Mucilaginibacter sp.]